MRTSNEVKISIEPARLACHESKDETHFLPFPLFVPIAEFDPADQCVGCGMSVRTEMLCDGKTRRILVSASRAGSMLIFTSFEVRARVKRNFQILNSMESRRNS